MELSHTQKRRLDALGLGLTVGLILPFFAVILFYSIRHSNISFWEFLKATAFIQMSSALLSLCAVPNLAAFFLFLQTYRYKSARGVILATLILAFVGFGLKFTLG